MSVKSAKIIFDDRTAVFAPGQCITGRVLLDIIGSLKIRSVTITFEGKAKVSFRESNATYYARQVYFKKPCTAVSAEGEGPLKAGQYIYLFNFKLPYWLPSTYQCKNGFIVYSATFKIDKKWGWNEKRTKDFAVYSPINLNCTPALAEPRQKKIEKFCWSFSCESGPIKMAAFIPYSGFVPGQYIPVTIELDNRSNQNVYCIEIRLKNVRKFISTQTKSKSLVIAYKSVTGVKKHTSATLVEQIPIPKSLEVHNFQFCGVITDLYFLYVKARIEGMHCNKTTCLEITLGNTPLTISSSDNQPNNS